MAETLSEQICSTSELAQVLGISDRRIQQLAREGILSPISRGRFRLCDAVQAYIRFLGHATPGKGQVDLKAERAMLTKAKRELAEIELAIARGEVHRSEDVEVVMNDMLSAFRSRILAVPVKTAPRLLAQTDMNTIQNILKADIYEALSELANYNPETFHKRNKEYLLSKAMQGDQYKGGKGRSEKED